MKRIVFALSSTGRCRAAPRRRSRPVPGGWRASAVRQPQRRAGTGLPPKLHQVFSTREPVGGTGRADRQQRQGQGVPLQYPSGPPATTVRCAGQHAGERQAGPAGGCRTASYAGGIRQTVTAGAGIPRKRRTISIVAAPSRAHARSTSLSHCASTTRPVPSIPIGTPSSPSSMRWTTRTCTASHTAQGTPTPATRTRAR